MKYYPYLRGRQAELQLLGKMAEEQLFSSNIVPIIEPVRDHALTLRTMEKLCRAQQTFYLVDTPKVGQYYLSEQPKYPYEDFFAEPQCLRALHYTGQTAFSAEPDLLIYPFDFLASRKLAPPADFCGKQLLPALAQPAALPPERLIVGESPFHFQKLADYQKTPDEFFSNTLMYFDHKTLAGVSDFLLGPARYIEKSYPRPGLVLHLTYQDPFGNLRIRHFVSAVIDSFQAPKERFFEAMTQVRQWCARHPLYAPKTAALRELDDYFARRAFPGMPGIKRLTWQHHLEVIAALLAQRNGTMKGETDENDDETS